MQAAAVIISMAALIALAVIMCLLFARPSSLCLLEHKGHGSLAPHPQFPLQGFTRHELNSVGAKGQDRDMGYTQTKNN